MPSPDEVKSMIEGAGGKVDEVHVLPDGHGFATASFPLPEDHWLMHPDYCVPPMPFRCGAGPMRDEWIGKIRLAAQYACRASTMNGKEMDFDPDAMVQNFIVGMLGYYTSDGLSSESYDIPDPLPPGMATKGEG